MAGHGHFEHNRQSPAGRRLPGAPLPGLSRAEPHPGRAASAWPSTARGTTRRSARTSTRPRPPRWRGSSWTPPTRSPTPRPTWRTPCRPAGCGAKQLAGLETVATAPGRPPSARRPTPATSTSEIRAVQGRAGRDGRRPDREHGPDTGGIPRRFAAGPSGAEAQGRRVLAATWPRPWRRCRTFLLREVYTSLANQARVAEGRRIIVGLFDAVRLPAQRAAPALPRSRRLRRPVPRRLRLHRRHDRPLLPPGTRPPVRAVTGKTPSGA